MFYVYKVTISPTQEFYFGARYSKKANPEDLGNTYFTSSSTVQKLLFTYGMSHCVFEVVNTFDDASKCRLTEHSLISAHKDDPKCLNKKQAGPMITEDRNKKISKSLKTHWSAHKQTRSQQNRGRTWKLSEEKAKKVSKHLNRYPKDNCKGRIWINNGMIDKRIPADESVPDGFKLGRLYMPWNNKAEK